MIWLHERERERPKLIDQIVGFGVKSKKRMASTTTVPVGKEEKKVSERKEEENNTHPFLPPIEEEEEIEYYESSGKDEQRPGGPFIQEICYDSSIWLILIRDAPKPSLIAEYAYISLIISFYFVLFVPIYL